MLSPCEHSTRIQKRKSPSTLKRNAKRREEFLFKKSTSESSVLTGLESNQKQCEAFQCDQCNSSFKTVNGLKIHKGKSHKEASSPEKLRKSHSQPSLIVSPVKDQSRVESCHNCDMEMSPNHLCEDDQDSHEEEAQAMSTLDFQTTMVMLMRDLQSV